MQALYFFFIKGIQLRLTPFNSIEPMFQTPGGTMSVAETSGLSVGIILFFCLILLALILLYRHKRKRKRRVVDVAISTNGNGLEHSKFEYYVSNNVLLPYT